MRVISIVALLFASAAALAPVKTAVRPATKAPFKVALPAVAGAVVAQIPLAAFASDVDLSLVNLILPVSSLVLLLTGVVAGILGYVTIGDGPANPKRRKGK
mmetsp:Transcript_27421/g.94326  ORF Transcript_27421/g.94326 Transcript_27421/m.94326 type:complete len:101 (-) Transcript_27421:69-371(-)